MSNTSAPVRHRLLAGVAAAGEAVDGLAGACVWSLDDADLAVALDAVAVLQARLAAVQLALVADADGRTLGRAQATGTAGWLRGRLRLAPGEARRTVGLALALRDECPATGAVLAAGGCSADQARVITTAMAGLPAVEPATRVAAEEFLIGQAAVLDPLLLRRAAEALTETLTTAPDGDGRALRELSRRELTAVPAGDGMVRLLGWFDREGWAQIAAVLDPLAAPAPARPPAAGPTGVLDPLAAPAPADSPGEPDRRSAARRRADALVELARLAGAALPADAGGLRPAATVTIDFDALLGRIREAGRLPDGEPISPQAARRIGCDAAILPAVLGATEQPLDVGRATRAIPPAIRRALTLRDQACAMPGCDRPPAWCDGHHIVHWADGGATALTNLVLLCGEHHHTVHHAGWTVTIDGDGLPTFHPPPWIDPDRAPRRHSRYTLRQLGYDLRGRDPTD